MPGPFRAAFISTDEADVIEAYRNAINWVRRHGQFSDAAKRDFASGADGWLVAFARAKGFTVVTQEVLNPEVKRKIPIPNVCQAFNVPYVDTFGMLRKLGVRWAL